MEVPFADVTGLRIRHFVDTIGQDVVTFEVRSKGNEYQAIRTKSIELSPRALRLQLFLTGTNAEINIAGVNAD